VYATFVCSTSSLCDLGRASALEAIWALVRCTLEVRVFDHYCMMLLVNAIMTDVRVDPAKFDLAEDNAWEAILGRTSRVMLLRTRRA
jgi:hypothetical protein